MILLSISHLSCLLFFSISEAYFLSYILALLIPLFYKLLVPGYVQNLSFIIEYESFLIWLDANSRLFSSISSIVLFCKLVMHLGLHTFDRTVHSSWNPLTFSLSVEILVILQRSKPVTAVWKHPSRHTLRFIHFQCSFHCKIISNYIILIRIIYSLLYSLPLSISTHLVCLYLPAYSNNSL